MALKGGLNILLWGISSTSKVFSNVVPRNRWKKSLLFLWKTCFSNFSRKKWSFLKQEGEHCFYQQLFPSASKSFSSLPMTIYVHGEFLYTKGKGFIQASPQNHQVKSNLTLTSSHKNTIQAKNQMIVTHLHGKSSF
jgi:hypothetical protein